MGEGRREVHLHTIKSPLNPRPAQTQIPSRHPVIFPTIKPRLARPERQTELDAREYRFPPLPSFAVFGLVAYAFAEPFDSSPGDSKSLHSFFLLQIQRGGS